MQVQVYVKKANAKYEVNFAELPKVTQEYIIAYGWRQAISDAVASAKSEAEAKGAADKRFDNLLKGIVRAERESDPVSQEARQIAVKMTNAWAKKNGVALTCKEDSDEKTQVQVKRNVEVWTDRVAKLKVHPEVLAQAEKNVNALAELDVEIDL